MHEVFGQFDLGLSADDEARAARLQAESVIVDLLFQGPCGYRAFSDDMVARLQADHAATGDDSAVLRAAIKAPIDLAVRGEFPTFGEHWAASGVTAGNRQIEPGDARFFTLTMGMAQAQFDRLEWLDKALTAADIRAAKSAGRDAGYVSTQLTYGPPDVSMLPALHDLGLRMCGLAYNVATAWGTGCTAGAGGLTSVGADAVRAMNDLGILVDVSHASAETARDACKVSDAPIVASHSGAAAVFRHDRNLPDDVLEDVARTGGVVGVPVVPFFLSAQRDASVSTWLDHVDHLVRLLGAEHVGIGTDWPMQLPKWGITTLLGGEVKSTGFRPEDHGLDDLTRNLVGFDDYRDFPNLTRGLVSRGYDDDDIRRLLGENALRVFAAVWGS